MADEDGPHLRADGALGRRTLAAVTLGSAVALLDGTVVNVALRELGADLDASLVELQWVINGYLLALASLILVGGALGDRLGRRRVYLLGVSGFALSSGLCALAQTPLQLVGFRGLQGLFAALLVPGSLAILQATFRREDRAAAIGTWAGLSGIAAAVGPLLGGLLVEYDWRWIFAINLPLCLLVVLLGRAIPETRDDTVDARPFDVTGAVLGVLVLGAGTYALTSWRELGLSVLALLLGVCAAGVALFVRAERRPGAMMPLTLFRSRVFSAANAMTLLVYGALAALMFFLVIQLQVGAGWSPLAAGLAPLPLTVTLLLLSSRFAVLSARTGPRLLMSLGPIVCAAGVVLLTPISGSTSYWLDVAPGMIVFSLGLAALVAPLTAAVLGAVPDRYAGVASGVNNAVARTGSLLAVAALPAVVGLAGTDYTDPERLTEGYRAAMLWCAALLTTGGVVSWVGLRDTGPPAPVPGTPTP